MRGRIRAHLTYANVISTLCLAVVAVVTGCGGGDETSTVSKVQFVEQANAICTGANSELAKAGQTFFGSNPQTAPSEGQFINEKVTPIFGGALDDLDALTPPAGDEAQVQAIVVAGHTALDRLQADPQLIKAAPGSAKDPFADFGRLANDYGLNCGS